jgi:hypothetical protein
MMTTSASVAMVHDPPYIIDFAKVRLDRPFSRLAMIAD